MTEQDLIDEARALVQEGIDEKIIRVTDWIVTAIVKKHIPNGCGCKDHDFHLMCAHGHVKSVVRRVTQDYKGTPEGDLPPNPQIVLPGFAHIQKGYLTIRDGASAVIAIELMTRDELMAKASSLRKMATGCIEHAVEIERYVEDHFPPLEANA